jgi:6,7-dimethyl-8-ribityllumazine synthase
MLQQSTSLKGLTPLATPPSCSHLNILIIHTRWNAPIITALVAGVTFTLETTFRLPTSNIHTYCVPGSYELPFAAKTMSETGRFDAVVAVGVLIKGDTMHFEYIADAVSHGLMNVQTQTSVPLVFGVLTCLTEEQVRHT